MELLQTVWDFLIGFNTTGNILTAIGFILGIIAVKTGLDFINEFRDVVEHYKEAKHPDSPGGEDVTNEEQKSIERELAEAVEAVWDKYNNTLFDIVARLFGKLRFW